MDSVTLKDILGIEEIDIELLVEAYSKLPNPERWDYQRRGIYIEVPVFSPMIKNYPWDGNIPETISYNIIRFEIRFDKGPLYWAPIKKVYVEK